MILGHDLGEFVIPAFTVLLNTSIAVFLSARASKGAYKRGYYAAQQTNEALALGRLMEQHKERQELADLTGWLDEPVDDQGSWVLSTDEHLDDDPR